MPKRTVLDPQGKTVKHALESMSFKGIKDVRIGKFIEVTSGPLGSHNSETKPTSEMFWYSGPGRFYCIYDIDTTASEPKVVLEIYKASEGLVPHHTSDVLFRLETNLFPDLGGRPSRRFPPPSCLRRCVKWSIAARTTWRIEYFRWLLRCFATVSQRHDANAIRRPICGEH